MAFQEIIDQGLPTQVLYGESFDSSARQLQLLLGVSPDFTVQSRFAVIVAYLQHSKRIKCATGYITEIICAIDDK